MSGSRSIVRRLRRVFGTSITSSPSTTVAACATVKAPARRSTSDQRKPTPRFCASLSSPAVGRGPRCDCPRSIGGRLTARRSPHVHLGALRPSGCERRRVCETGDVACDQALALCVVQQLVEHRMHVVDRRQRQALARSPSRLQQRPVHRVEIGRSQLLQRNITETRQDVRVKGAAIAAKRRRPCALGSRARRAMARRTRESASGSAQRTFPPDERRATRSATTALPSWCGTSVWSDGAFRPPARWRARPTMLLRKASPGGTPCRWP